MELKDLGPLAKTLTAAGAPFLGKLLGSVLPFPFNLAASAVLTQLGDALGTSADPTAINDAINANPGAISEKLQELEDKYKSELDFANLQVGLDMKEAESSNFFIAGWRPTFAWLCIIMVAYQLIATTSMYPPLHIIPGSTFDPIWIAFGGLLGLRTTEKALGVARETIGSVIQGGVINKIKKAFTR